MKIKNILIIFLSILCLYFFLSAKIKDKQNNKIISQNTTLPGDTKRSFTVENRKVIYKYRKQNATVNNSAATGKKEEENIALETYYFAPEGEVEISQKQDDSFEINVKNKGFTFKPFAGGFFNSKKVFDYGLGARVIYYNRFGLGFLLSVEAGAALALDRRLDDVLPFENTSFMIYGSGRSFGLGLAVYL
ncbi:MAG: hypothetical protein LBM71_00840 [Elusimicrobiota bacterium]|jgi:hypothetical protein|nr:hypothetical protein [Elusimicrobiota bacterium]